MRQEDSAPCPVSVSSRAYSRPATGQSRAARRTTPPWLNTLMTSRPEREPTSLIPPCAQRHANHDPRHTAQLGAHQSDRASMLAGGVLRGMTKGLAVVDEISVRAVAAAVS